jgi:alpha-tubulin suppressor-like RCC1 family protein
LALTKKTGEVYGWGKNDFGKLCQKYTIFRDRERDLSQMRILKRLDVANIVTPIKFHKFDTSIRQICCGVNHSAVVTDGGNVYTWGFAGNGRLGISDETLSMKRKMEDYLLQGNVNALIFS